MEYIYSKGTKHPEKQIETEKSLDKLVVRSADVLFGPNRIYIPAKIRIGGQKKGSGIPDGFLFDFSSMGNPKLFLVEVELGSHDVFREIGAQLLRFSVALESGRENLIKSLGAVIEKSPGIHRKFSELLPRSGFFGIHDFLVSVLKQYDLRMRQLIFFSDNTILVFISKPENSFRLWIIN